MGAHVKKRCTMPSSHEFCLAVFEVTKQHDVKVFLVDVDELRIRFIAFVCPVPRYLR